MTHDEIREMVREANRERRPAPFVVERVTIGPPDQDNFANDRILRAAWHATVDGDVDVRIIRRWV